MPAELRIYRRRIRSVKSTKKITRAMELIAASRIRRAQTRVAATTPYARELTRVVSAVTSNTTVEHPLTVEHEDPQRAAVLVITSDRGFAGAYNSSILRAGDQLTSLLRQRGLAVSHYVVGRKGVNFFSFRERPMAGQWQGFSEQPTYADAKEVGDALIGAFLVDTGAGARAGADSDAAADAAANAADDEVVGVDEIYIVYTEFVSLGTQRTEAKRILPLEVEDTDETFPLYEFEPAAEEVLDALVPRYVESRVYNAMLQAAASEQAARQRAMKSASDNADDLIRSLNRLANAARQAGITQEISEIVGGADALASASNVND
jgi:F-type H+-transporting ATPase subunit gamma